MSSAVTITCEAKGIPNNLTYTWHKSGSPVTDGGKFSGANTDTLTITGIDVTEAGSYECIPMNLFGNHNTSFTLVFVRRK